MDSSESDSGVLNPDKETVTLSSEELAASDVESASRQIGRVHDSTRAALGLGMATLSGKTIGNYQIENELGRGAMGVVYKAKQLSMDRYVALKFLPKRLAQDERILQRFTREARAAGQLSHPNIVSVHDVGVLDGFHYIAMELVDGNSVQSHIKAKGPCSEKEALEIARQIAEALKYAHNRGILHRDIKPDNFLIDSHGRVRLADLGLARVTNPDSSKEADLTQDGTALGTPHYMSPEQCKGEPVDARSDLYGLGAALFVMVSNHTPYDAPTAAAVMVKVLTEHPKPLKKLCPQLSPGFVAFVDKMMAKDPAKRFPDAQHVIDAIEKVKAGTYKIPATSHHTKVPAHPPLAHAPRYKLVLMGAGAAVVALIVLGILAGKRKENEAAGGASNGGAALVDPKTLEANSGTQSNAATAKADDPVKSAMKEVAQTPVANTAPATANAKDNDERDTQRMELRKRWRELDVELKGKLRRNPGAAAQRVEEFLRNNPRAHPDAGPELARLREAEEKLKKEYTEARAEAETALKAGNKPRAFDIFLRFVGTHEGSPQAQEWVRDVQVLFVSESRKEAAKFLKDGDLDKAESVLLLAQRVIPKEQTAGVSQDLEGVRAARKRAQTVREADEKRIAELFERTRQAVLEAEVPSGKRYDVGKAVSLVQDELGRFQTEAARQTADALGQVYTRAADVVRRMKVSVNAKNGIELPSLGNFKMVCVVQKWEDANVLFRAGELQQQSLPLKNVLPENLLELAKKLSIGTGATSDDQYDLGSLAFAIGVDAVAAQAFEKITADKSLRAIVSAAQRFLKTDAVPSGQAQGGAALPENREAAAQKLFEELNAARGNKDQAAALKLSTRLVVDYADTQFVKGRHKQIQQLSAPGSEPIDLEAAPLPAVAADDSAVVELKKLGFVTVDGDWQFDKGSKSSFVIANGRAEAELKDGAIALSYVLDEGAVIELFVRADGGSPEALRERARYTAYNIDIAEGYGVHATRTEAQVYSDKSAGMTVAGTTRGNLERQPVPLRIQTLSHQPGPHAASVQVRGDELIVTIDDRTFRTKEKLREGGTFVLRVTGRAKVAGLKLAR